VRDSQNHAIGPEDLDQSTCKGDLNCVVVFLESRYLKPGERATDHFKFDQKYDLSRPGVYTVQVVRREKPNGVFYEIAKANVLTFPVTR
jgi:hypothetical protein